jgi:rRNA maturation endonuclease Nob1
MSKKVNLKNSDSVEPEIKDYRCGKCGRNFTEKHKRCPHCGIEFE